MVTGDKIKIVFISDTHNRHKNLQLPAGDVLIHCGDFTNQGMLREIRVFGDWLNEQQGYLHRIVIAGNHDWEFQRRPRHAFEELLALRHWKHSIIYLQDSETTLNIKGRDIRIYGSPWQPCFNNWAFNLPSDQLEVVWKKIPQGIDVLVTHGPPFGILDVIESGEHVGCVHLLKKVSSVRPKIHAFGHIHEAHGVVELGGIKYINAATCSHDFQSLNQPIVIEI